MADPKKKKDPRPNAVVDLFADTPFGEWLPLSEDFDGPAVPALINVRATIKGVPVPIEYPNGTIDPSGTIYIKACDELKPFIQWMARSIKDKNIVPQHPAASAYHRMEDPSIFPVDGLQFRYITEEKLQEVRNG